VARRDLFEDDDGQTLVGSSASSASINSDLIPDMSVSTSLVML